MKLLKNIGVGFLVSFLGSLPLGFINVVGAQVYKVFGIAALVEFIFGVILIEGIVIYLTFVFAGYLTSHKRVLKAIEFLSPFFMLVIAYLFYSQSSGSAHTFYLLNKSPFLIGVTFNLVNFLQLPFWIGWNLYVVANKYVSDAKGLRYFYILGTLAGSFAGILVVALALFRLSNAGGFLSEHLMQHIIPLFFVGMAVYQAIKFYRKYYRSARAKKSEI